MRWFRRRRRSSVTKHYREHKEQARALIYARLVHWNRFYGFTYNRVSIRNQRTCWGSCSDKGNLNFSYKLLFLPEHLADYIIVHELCHLQELNHGRRFWQLVAQTLPAYKAHKQELRTLERIGMARYLGSQQQRTAVLMVPESEGRERSVR